MSLVIIDGVEFNAIAAVTESEQMVGLMYREWPPPIMFFPYKQSEYRKFWMKNTPSPLDIVFCNNGKIIDVKQGEPFSTTLVGPSETCDLVIEFPRGTVERKGFKIG